MTRTDTSTKPAPRGAGSTSLLVALALLLSAVASARPAAASDPMPKLGLRPSGSDGIYFTETIKPGKRAKLAVELVNAGERDVRALTYAADVYTLVNGGFGVALSDAPATGVTTWVDYPTQTLDLPRGKGQIVDFTVKVPKGTAPGQYITSLVIQNAEPVKGEGGVAVEQVLRQAVAVAITVPADLTPALAIGAVTYHDNPLMDSVQIEVQNIGNAHLKPAGSVHIADSAGKTVLDAPVEMATVYAGMSTALEISLADPLPSDDYTATVKLADAEIGAAAEIDAQPFTVVDTPQASTDPRVDTLTVTPVRATPDGPVRMADVAVAIENPGPPLADAQVVLHVERDDQLVEDYPLAPKGTLTSGATSFQQRYMPLTGWQPGSYTFTVRIETTDPATGQPTVREASEPATVDIQE